MYQNSPRDPTWSSQPENELEGFASENGELSLSSESMIDVLTAVLDRGAAFRFQAKGNSMFPFIIDGDVLILKKLETMPVVGDVLAFIHPVNQTLVVHRVVNKLDEDYLMKGDYSSKSDGFVPEVNLLGIVYMVERNGKTVSIGLGWEKGIVAILSNKGLLQPFSVYCYRLISWIRQLVI
ncbi:MAG: S26 family signal peptidase [Methanotrichaceae archaeon]|nr:S26 family signal peptidase [Methanotrichaceae archaeon]